MEDHAKQGGPTLDDWEKLALYHYRYISEKCCDHMPVIEKAIKFYYECLRDGEPIAWAVNEKEQGGAEELLLFRERKEAAFHIDYSGLHSQLIPLMRKPRLEE